MESFATVLTCMDGRIQRKVADYLATIFGARNLDTITTAGLVKHLAGDTEQTDTLLENLAISRQSHGSRQIAVVAHHDCAGNPISANKQKDQLASAARKLRELHADAEVQAIWVGPGWIVGRVPLPG